MEFQKAKELDNGDLVTHKEYGRCLIVDIRKGNGIVMKLWPYSEKSRTRLAGRIKVENWDNLSFIEDNLEAIEEVISE